MNIEAQEEKIRKAAEALSQALTETGRDYEVWVHRIDATSLLDEEPRYVYETRVVEKNDREVTRLG